MRWQRIAQFAIAGFIIVFLVVLVVAMRRESAAPPTSDTSTPGAPEGARFHSPSPGVLERFDGDRKVLELRAGALTQLGDDRVLLAEGVRVLTNRNGRDLVINAREADVKLKGGNDIAAATFKGKVSLTTAGGMEVESEEASYTQADGIVKVPGPVAFRKGRMSGSGTGATYDANREVLWLLENATIKVTPDKDGTGGLDGAAASAGLARAEHYTRLMKAARITAEGRVMAADEITITFAEDDERVQMVQLRGNSSITGGSGSPQSMSAKDIDLTYGADGRTLQNANLIENAVVQMANPGRQRIAARTITIGLAPDGTTVTHLAGNEGVQVDLPAEPKVPAKRIRAATLVANGKPGAGLQNATFTGKVEYRETQAATRNGAAVDRTARSDTLTIETAPGLGAIEKADFRGNVTFDDVNDLHAEGPRGLYHLDRDRLELISSNDPGKPPRVTDGKISVSARTIEMTLATRDLSADTEVRSTLRARSSGRGQQSKIPSVLKQDEPVNITSNRLHYEGAASRATYTGNVTMWQDAPDAEGASIKGDTLVIDDKTGNLEAIGNAITVFLLEDTDTKTKQRRKTRTIGKAEKFVFDDARRLATYTGNAQLDGAQGNLTAEKIEVFLKQGASEVERLEAYAPANGVTVRESFRTAHGNHLTYTASNDMYLMVGTPVTGIEEEKSACRVGTAASLWFQRGAESGSWKMEGAGKYAPTEMKSVPCSSVKR